MNLLIFIFCRNNGLDSLRTTKFQYTHSVAFSSAPNQLTITHRLYQDLPGQAQSP